MTMTDHERTLITETHTDVKDIKRILNGNGELGLVAKTINNEAHLRKHDRLIARVSNKIWALILIVISAALGVYLTGCTRITIGDAAYTQILQNKSYRIQAVDPETGSVIILEIKSDNEPFIILADKAPGAIF